MTPNPEPARFPAAANLFYVIASVALLIAVLRIVGSVFVPITLALLLAFILSPMVRLLERWRLGRTLSVLVTCTVACAAIGLTAWALVAQIQVLAIDLPNHKNEILTKLDSFKTSDDSTFGRLTNLLDELFPAAPVVASHGSRLHRLPPQAGRDGQAPRPDRNAFGRRLDHHPLRTAMQSPVSRFGASSPCGVRRATVLDNHGV